MGIRYICTTFIAFRRSNLASTAKYYTRKVLSKTGSGGSLLGLGLMGYSTKEFKIEDFMAEPITPIERLNKVDSEDMRRIFELFIMKVQKEVCDKIKQVEDDYVKSGLELEDGAVKSSQFLIDRWSRAEGGGGITCIMEDGQVFERAGVNISVVHGNLPPSAMASMRERGHEIKIAPGQKGVPFFACGVSSVIHPRNPHIPTVHFNYRYFELEEQTDDPKKPKISWWFGGGTDMTPYILHDEDVVHFHNSLKQACDAHDLTYYSTFKKWCDRYFVNTHRGECRGVGGLFFDDLDTHGREKTFNFVTSCAASIIPCYFPIIEKRLNQGYSYKDRQWQLIRRGRYVEFNLVHDRGTKFGLFTPGARIESILMSLPSEAKWKYNHVPAEGSEEARLVKILKEPKDWV